MQRMFDFIGRVLALAGALVAPALAQDPGITGMTAYFAQLDVGNPKAGETVVVDAASGAVGSVVGQLAKHLGCRVVGIAGGPTKCAYVVQELGFDACVDHNAPTFAEDLKAQLPNGIDCLFENVGGPIFEMRSGQVTLHPMYLRAPMKASCRPQ